MKKDFVSRQQLELLPKRIRMVQETDASKELALYISQLVNEKKVSTLKILLAGAGGSYPVAVFGKHVLHNNLFTKCVDAVTPQTAFSILSQFNYGINGENENQYDLVIGISYSGKTSDIKLISDVCKNLKIHFLLLTGAEKFTLSNIYQEDKFLKIISYFNDKDLTKENSMVSMASTLEPIVVFYNFWLDKIHSIDQQSLTNAEQFISNLDIHKIAASLKKYPIIHVFYDWSTLPVAVDIESKFTESGIAHVILHEKGNFLHGRFTLLYKQDFSLAIYLDNHGAIINKDFYKRSYEYHLSQLLEKTCQDKHAYFFKIGPSSVFPFEWNSNMEPQWNIEALLTLPYLITSIGEELNIDIAKPHFPKEAFPNYYYKKDF